MFLAELVVITLVCFFQSANEAAGAVSARLSLRPLSERDNEMQDSGKTMPRERERLRLLLFEIRIQEARAFLPSPSRGELYT
jgi:hypothetical protein